MTGLSAHVIRVWEKRYAAVAPSRTDTNRRLYSAEDIERLRLLAQATSAGNRISNLAALSSDELRDVIAATGGDPAFALPRADDDGAGESAARGGRFRPEEATVAAELVADALEATQRFAPQQLEEVLRRGAVRLGHNGLLSQVVSPLAVQIGDLWQMGRLTAAHEHFATALIRNFLGQHARPYPTGHDAPCAVVATPAGQLHELGAVMVAALAANLGWRVVYLGTSLPAAEIAGAALQNRARAVILSIVYPPDDLRLAADMEHLRTLLPTGVTVLAGGRAAAAYHDTLQRIGAQRPDSLDELALALDEMRQPVRATATAVTA